jgi:hypothetical protein
VIAGLVLLRLARLTAFLAALGWMEIIAEGLTHEGCLTYREGEWPSAIAADYLDVAFLLRCFITHSVSFMHASLFG